MRGVPRHKTKFLKTPSRDDFEENDQKELQEVELEMTPVKPLLPPSLPAKKKKKKKRKSSKRKKTKT